MKNYKIKIYQVPISCDFCFRGYAKDKFDFSQYIEVYDGEVLVNPDENVLEEIYTIFNCDHPINYHGRSLSVSDIVYYNNTYYYCDIIGWQRIKI